MVRGFCRRSICSSCACFRSDGILAVLGGLILQGDGTEAQVTWDDQQNINRFGRLNNRLHELADEIRLAKVSFPLGAPLLFLGCSCCYEYSIRFQ